MYIEGRFASRRRHELMHKGGGCADVSATSHTEVEQTVRPHLQVWLEPGLPRPKRAPVVGQRQDDLLAALPRLV